MAYTDSTYNSSDQSILAAIVISLGLHAVAVAILNPFQFDADKVTPPLVVELQPPKPEPPPPPPPEPEPPKPEPPKPEPPKPEPPKPQPKKAPPPPVKTPLPPPEVRATVPTAPPPPPPQVIAAAPEKTVEPTFVAPEPEKPRPPEPVVEEQPDLGKYGELLAREFAKHKQYPRIAQMRGWQGTVRVKLDIENGVIVASGLSESSSYEALDKQALETARKGKLFPPLPDSMKNRTFTITVPIVFRLE